MASLYRLEIVLATSDDAKEIFELQRRAFHQQAVLYERFDLPPLVETYDEYLKTFAAFTILKAVSAGCVVGAVRAQCVDTTCHITRLIVHPDCQNRGIGRQLMEKIEERFDKQVTRFELFTGHRSEKSLRLYKRLGYSVFKTATDYPVPICYLEKCRSGDLGAVANYSTCR